MQHGRKRSDLALIVRNRGGTLVLGGQHQSAQSLQRCAHDVRLGVSCRGEVHGLAGDLRNMPSPDRSRATEQANAQEREGCDNTELPGETGAPAQPCN